MNVLEEEVRRIGIAAENGPLFAVGTPFPACAVLRPDDFVDDDETDVAEQREEIGRQRKDEETVLCMLVDVRSDQAKFSARHEYAEAFLESGAHLVEKLGVNTDVP